MTIRALNNTLKNSLMNYEPFIVAHLIKFEKPQSVSQYGGKLQGLATDYTYITDAQYDITYQDGSSSLNSSTPHPAQIYRANKITKIGTINESIQAKASNLSLTLDTASLGATATTSATFTASKMAGTVDLAEKGFQEGDKILLSGSGTNAGAYIRIDSFEDEGKTIVFTQISSITAHTSSEQIYTITLSAEEINILLADKGSSSYTSYINREVIIYKVHINPETREIIGGTNGPFLYFKGITSGASINEKVDSSEVTWTLSSHWGDFVRIQGRLTDDATHRALRADGSPDVDSVIKPEYAGDLGFLHSNTAINHLATYNTTEIEYEQVDINGGWFGGKRLREIEVVVPRQTDIQFNIQAKMLPVVYGVRKVDSFPVFVDTHKDSSAEVYKVDAICEGPIAGVLDIYIEGNSTICLDLTDFNTRNPGGTDFGDGSSVEIKCVGRMDRGDTLAHSSINTGAPQFYANSFLNTEEEYRNFSENFSPFNQVNYGQAAQGTSVGTGASATGIRHEGTHSITSPLNASFTFHSGLENQKADNTLVSTASSNSFKIQNSYYTGKHKYWGPSHRLLDTAYMVGKYTIQEGETSIPTLKFVVRGRDPECYNYDGSYKHDDTTGSGQSPTNFILGESVTLHKTSDNSQIGSAVTIIDKWSTFDTDGNSDHRFRFSPEPSLGTTTSFYMKDASNNRWHMQTWDHAETVDSPGGAMLHASISTGAGTARGRKITLTNSSASFQFAVSNANAVLGVISDTNAGLIASSYSDFTYNNNVIDNITRFSSDPGITGVYVKNAIQLDSTTASSTNDYYNGNKITLVSGANTSAPYIQERTIIDYDGSTKVAIVNSPWDYNHQPKAGEATSAYQVEYSIGSIGDRRVTLNPAMQLLDYMTNKRYGKGLDIVEDINIDSWKNAAKECDTRSEVTVAMAGSETTGVTPGEVWRYPQIGAVQFMGTVKSRTPRGNTLEVVFKDVVGKLGTKWNSWQSFASEELYWYEGSVYEGTGSTVTSAPSSGALTEVILYTDSSSSRNVNISSASANGNPLVKAYSVRNSNYSDSGYSLYDADDVQYWRYVGWDDSSQRNVTRHQMNQVVDTKLPVFDNINRMLTQFNGILRYSVGKYELDIKSKAGVAHAAEKISNEDIIGTIKLSDKGLKNSKNYVSTSILDPNNKFEGRSISFFNSDYLKEDKGIQKKGQFSLPGITNYFNARFNIKQYLDESRYGLTIQFTMAPRGLLLVAGSIIEFTYPRFGYSSKPFRITNLNFKKDGTVDVTADEHNNDAYVIEEISDGLGITEEVAPGQGQGSFAIPNRPIGLVATQANQGEVILTWNNTTNFNPASHVTEIWRSGTNNFAAVDGNGDLLATLIGTSIVDSFHDPISEGEGLKTRYYWIRYMVKMPTRLAGNEFRNVPSLYYPNTDDSGFTNGEGITGIGLAINAVRSVKLSPGTTQSFVYKNDESGIQSGYPTSTNILATARNTAGTVSYKWYNNGTEISGQTDATYDNYQPASTFSGMPHTISVEMTDTVGSETFTATDSLAFTATKIVVNGNPAIPGFTVTASAGTFVFNATTTGVVNDRSNFLNIFTVLKGSTTLSYDPTSTYDANSYRYGTFGTVNPTGAVSPIVNPTSGAISIGSTGTFLSGSSVTQATFTVPIIENSTGITIAVFLISLTKLLTATNGTAAIKSSIVYAWQRSSSALTSNPGSATVNLNSGKITSSLGNGWEKNIDDTSGTDPLYVVAATAAGLGSSDTIDADDWTDPVILVRDGAASRAVKLTASTQVIRYSPAGTETPSNQSILFTTSTQGFSGTVTYRFLVGSSSSGTGAASTFTLSDAHEPAAGGSAVVKVEVFEDGTKKAEDSVTVYGIQNGESGVDSLSVILSNESHTVPTTNAGVTSFTGSGTTISVYEGATLLDYDGSGTTNGHWTVSATESQTGGSDNITAGGITESGNLALVADHSAMTVTASTITYTITGKTLDGTAINITKVQSISKSTDGQKGLNSATVFIYKKTNSSTETSIPSGDTTYTFESGAVSFTTASGWSATVPNNTNTYLWVRQATAASTATQDTIGDSEWSPALLIAQSGGAGVRGGSVFNFEQSTNGNISADTASRFAGVTSFTENAAIAVAAAVIASAQDSTIRANDRITVTDNNANIAATRVYSGGAQTNSGSVDVDNFSSLIVETFDGSVIVDGTLSADKLLANTTISNNVYVASNMVLGTASTPGTFHSNNKSQFGQTNPGFFLGATGTSPNITAYKVDIGDSTSYLRWNGSTLTIAGTIAMTGSSTIGGTTASTVVSGANAGATANQDSTADILGGNHTGTIGGTTASTVVSGANAGATANQDSTADILGGDHTGTVGSTANATVANAHTTAGGSSTGNSRVFMSSSGLIVVDGSGNRRVKIGHIANLTP